MNKIKKIIATFVLLIAFAASALACEITFEILQGEKDSYSAGDVIIVRVKVEFTHRVCPEGIKSTEFKMDGVKVLGAKDWVELSPGSFTRDLKVSITESGKEVSLAGQRTCDKDGGFGKITFTTK